MTSWDQPDADPLADLIAAKEKAERDYDAMRVTPRDVVDELARRMFVPTAPPSGLIVASTSRQNGQSQIAPSGETLADLHGMTYSYDPREMSVQDAEDEARWEKFRREGGAVVDGNGKVIGRMLPATPAPDEPGGWVATLELAEGVEFS